MTIKYYGKTENLNRCAIITYKNDKENDKADKVIETIENEDYKIIGIFDCDETTDIHIEVEDREDFENLKEIYMEAKRA